ncbi:hypothetical protein EJ04DRAFT_413113, partial [Polyplosphaeria fusca]
YAKVYALAEKYDVLGLKQLDIDKFVASSTDHFTNSGFFDAIDAVYMSTVDTDLELRDIVADYVCYDLETFGLCERLEKKLEYVPDPAFRVM